MPLQTAIFATDIAAILSASSVSYNATVVAAVNATEFSADSSSDVSAFHATINVPKFSTFLITFCTTIGSAYCAANQSAIDASFFAT